jgi:hypothetical protein
MSTPPQDPAGQSTGPRSDDPTRDIRLPPVPDRPQAVVRPPAQAAPPSAPLPVSEEPEPRPPSTADAPPAKGTVSPDLSSRPAPPRPYVLPNERDNETSSPPLVRQRTRAFDASAEGVPGAGAPRPPGHPAPGQGPPRIGTKPFGPGQGTPSSGPSVHGAPADGPPGRDADPAPARQRRWPWVVLTLVPILVIVVSGLMLFFLLRGN